MTSQITWCGSLVPRPATLLLGSERVVAGSGIEKNAVRDSGNVNGLRDLIETGDTGFATIWASVQD